MTREPAGTAELVFLQAVLKRGFVHIPRMLFDYATDVDLDYSTIGKLFTVLAVVGGPSDSSFGPYTISRRQQPHDFEQIRGLLKDLEDEVLVERQDDGDEITFSFLPMYARLRALWEPARERYQEEAARGNKHPAIHTAEQMLGRLLSSHEMNDIMDWMETYGFDIPMVQAVIQEGKSSGVIRMNYLNQIARQWAEEGLRTPDDVEAHKQRSRKLNARHRSVVQYLGIQRPLTGAEQTLLDKWSDEWGFSNEVIIRACAETHGAKNPLQYMNRILERWRDLGVRTVADAEQVLVEFKRQSASADAGKGSRTRKQAPPPKSNVFLQREKKDDKYYDHIFKKFDD